MVKGMLMARDEEAARAFAQEIEELNQVEITESGPVVTKNRNRNQNKSSAAFQGYQATNREKAEVRA
jgi:hypothetical protein